MKDPMLASTEFAPQSPHFDTPPLLIAHGLFGSGRNWRVIAKTLSAQRRVICVDMRNHGHSLHDPDHSYPTLARDLAQIVHQLDAEQVDILGHSMGGKAAMMLAQSYPDKLRRVIIGDIAPVAYEHTQMPVLDAMRRVDLTNVARRADANGQLAQLGIEPSLCQFLTQSLDIKEKRWLLNLDALAQNMPQIIGFPTLDQTSQSPVSTLFLSGAHSDYILPEHRGLIRAQFPKSRFAKLSNAGHWLHADQPQAFCETVEGFLNAPTHTEL